MSDAQSNNTGQDPPVFRRRVFYIPGYDPIHPRRYRELYRREGQDQAVISGYQLELTPKKVKGPYGWHVNALMDGRHAQADIEVLVWADLVKTSMARGIPGTYWQLLCTAWAYIGSGALFRLMRLRKGPMIAAMYPIFALLAQLAVAMAAGYLAARATFSLLDSVSGLLEMLAMDTVLRPSGSLIAPYAWWLIFAAVSVLVLTRFRAADNKLFAYYLMHDYAYSAQAGGANPPELEARMAQFRQTIAEALTRDFDEVLVVGHSSGAHLAVSILADMIRAGLPENRPALALLSLGQVVPMVSFLPEARRLRADLRFLSSHDELVWIDVTAPGDGCAFALCDPVSVSGVAPENKRWPLVISAAFTQTLSPERWKALRWRFFRLHFQYLCAFDRPRDYDYFRITAGPMTLAERFKDRPASKSRIETAVSGYRTVA
jgi:hypothetical protein